jgi:hypothetical protein
MAQSLLSYINGCIVSKLFFMYTKNIQCINIKSGAKGQTYVARWPTKSDFENVRIFIVKMKQLGLNIKGSSCVAIIVWKQGEQR